MNSTDPQAAPFLNSHTLAIADSLANESEDMVKLLRLAQKNFRPATCIRLYASIPVYGLSAREFIWPEDMIYP
jgi:hypothetical protein